MFERLKSALQQFHLPRIMPSIEDEELAYLNGALSLVDLERREREIDSGRFSTRAFGH